MALNPEIVANILQTQLNKNCVGDWYKGGKTPRDIEKKAMERATSPTSFTDWLVSQYFFKLREDIDRYDFEADLINQLVTADKTVIREEIRLMTHNILYIESRTLQVEMFVDLVREYAKDHYGIPARQIKFKHISYPPEDSKLTQLLNEHTGALLHNLSLSDLMTINEEVNKNPGLASKLVVIKSGFSTTGEHDNLYNLMKNQGIMVIRKPFPSIEEAVRVVLGVV